MRTTHTSSPSTHGTTHAADEAPGRASNDRYRLHLTGKARRHGSVASPADLVRVLHEGGLPALAVFEGPFAAEVTDRGAGTTALVRDPLGEEALYYRVVDGEPVWSTRLEPLLADEPRSRFDGEALREALNYRWCLGDQALVQGIGQVQPGTAVVFGRGGPRTEVIEDLVYEPGPLSALDDWADQLIEALRAEMRPRLAASERPMVLLSGGVDSALLAALAHELRSDTVAVSPTWANGEDPELPRARMVAEHLGIEHRVLRIEDDEIAEATADITGLLDVPPKDHWAIALLATFRRLEGTADLVLHGAGADMILGSRSRERIAEAARRAFVRNLIPGPVRRLLAWPLPLDRSHLGDVRAILEEDPRLELDRMGLIEFHRALRAAHRPVFGNGDPSPTLIDRFRSPRGNDYEARLRMSVYTWVRIHTFEVTRLAGSCGIETSFPYVTKASRDLAFRMPAERAYDRERVRKPVIRRAHQRYFPEPWSRWPKLGFVTPTVGWHQECIAAWTDDRLGPGSIADRLIGPGLEAFTVERDHQHLFTLAALEDFSRRFGVELPDA